MCAVAQDKAQAEKTGEPITIRYVISFPEKLKVDWPSYGSRVIAEVYIQKPRLYIYYDRTVSCVCVSVVYFPTVLT